MTLDLIENHRQNILLHITYLNAKDAKN